MTKTALASIGLAKLSYQSKLCLFMLSYYHLAYTIAIVDNKIRI